MKKTVNVLHLSDLHFGIEASGECTETALARRKLTLDGLINVLSGIESSLKPHVVVISGDIGWKGLDTDYRQAREWIENKLLKAMGLTSEDLIVCAGNHDIDRDETTGLEPPSSPDKADDWLSIEKLKNFIRPFEAFNRFCEDLKIPEPYINDKPFHLIGAREQKGLQFVVLNSAWFCRGKKDKDKLWLGLPQLQRMSAATQLADPGQYDSGPIFIGILHHPPEWLNDAETTSRKGRLAAFNYLAQHCHLILSGHVHGDPDAPDRISERAFLFKGGATYFGDNYKNNFSIFQIHPDDRTFFRCVFEFDPESSNWNTTIGEVQSLKKPEPVKKKIDTSLSGDLDTEINSYCQKAESLHETLPVAGFATHLKVTIDIEDIYIPLRAVIDLRGIGKATFADAADADKCLMGCDGGLEISLPEAFRQTEMRKKRGIVILGDPGSGKTTHLKRLLLYCLRKGPQEVGLPSGMLPVFLPLRELDRLDQGLDGFIQAQLDSPHLKTPDGFGKRLLERGNLLFLLDGLDEVGDLSKREKVAEWIVDALKSYKTCRFVVTCRFAGYSPTVRLSEQFLEMHIRPFNEDQVERFISNWYAIVEKGLAKDPEQASGIADEKSKDLIARLKEPDFRSRRVFELTRNPLLLANICLVHRHRGGLPKKRAHLYEERIDVLLEHWRGAKKLNINISAQDGRRALQPAAYWLHSQEGRTRATAAELSPRIEPILKAIDWKQGTAVDFLRMIREESGLLTGWDQDSYGFMHLGFQEYLAAREIRTRAFNDPSVLSALAARFGESWWQEVTLLMLALEDPSLFEQFMTEVTKHSGFSEFPNLVDACIEEAAEVSVSPFKAILEMEPGNDHNLWVRQFVALRVLSRFDDDEVKNLTSKLAHHRYEKIRRWIRGRKAQTSQDVIYATKGGYELVRIPGGVFMMGSPQSEAGRYSDEGPIHEVHVPDFYMGRYPVINEEYGLFLRENLDAPEPKFWADRRLNQPRQPVVGVSWNDAQRYAKWAGLRLPSEAEWEYACRADGTTRYNKGNAKKDLARAGWYNKNSGSQTHPVGEKEPNKLGLYDIHGNVWEWVEDDWHSNYDGAPVDSGVWASQKRAANRVIRGGGWYHGAPDCRSATRDYAWPNERGSALGFRLSRSVDLGA